MFLQLNNAYFVIISQPFKLTCFTFIKINLHNSNMCNQIISIQLSIDGRVHIIWNSHSVTVTYVYVIYDTVDTYMIILYDNVHKLLHKLNTFCKKVN